MPWYATLYLIIAVLVAIGVWLRMVVDAVQYDLMIAVLLGCTLFPMGAILLGSVWPLAAVVSLIWFWVGDW